MPTVTPFQSFTNSLRSALHRVCKDDPRCFHRDFQISVILEPLGDDDPPKFLSLPYEFERGDLIEWVDVIYTLDRIEQVEGEPTAFYNVSLG